MITPPAALEVLLFSSGGPLEKKRLTALLGLSDEQFAAALAALEKMFEGHGLALVSTDTMVEIRTSAAATEIVTKLHESELARDLGKGSLETLAVIAYREGATRSEIDWIRGVNSSAALRTLLLRGLIEGTEDILDKRRTRYALTTEALAYLGLSSVQELPRFEELRAATEAVSATV